MPPKKAIKHPTKRKAGGRGDAQQTDGAQLKKATGGGTAALTALEVRSLLARGPAVVVTGHPQEEYHDVFRKTSFDERGDARYRTATGLHLYYNARCSCWVASNSYLPMATEADIHSQATNRVEAPGDSPPAGEQVWYLEGREIKLTLTLVSCEAELQKQVAPILARRRATEAAALAAADDQLAGVAAVAVDGVPEQSCLGEKYNDVYLSAGRHAGWLHFASESGKHLYYYSVFGAWLLHGDYTSEGRGIAAFDAEDGLIPVGEMEWRCYGRGKWSNGTVITSLLNTQDDVVAYTDRKEQEKREAQEAEDECTAERRKLMVKRIQQKVEQYLAGEIPSFLDVQPGVSSAKSLSHSNVSEATTAVLPMSAHESPCPRGSGPPFPRMGVSIEGVLLIQSMFENVLTEDTTTSDICHLIVRPLTCDPRYRDISTATHRLHGWYSHRYVVRGSEMQTLPATVDAPDAPSATWSVSRSWCDLLCTDPAKAKWGAPATGFFSHAWSFKFCDVVGALKRLASQRTDDAERVYFWFDICCVDQHITETVPRDWWSTTFKSAIADIGSTVMMLSPWVRMPMPP
eukprot:COSAG02_NODE_5629_length_4171_cov_2.909180_1_plen_574_part_00